MTLLIILMGLGLFASNIIGVVTCYVLGYRVGIKRGEQLVKPIASPEDLYSQCLCGHLTTSHKKDKDGNFGECTAYIRGQGNCACEGHISDTSSTLIRSAYQL